MNEIKNHLDAIKDFDGLCALLEFTFQDLTALQVRALIEFLKRAQQFGERDTWWETLDADEEYIKAWSL